MNQMINKKKLIKSYPIYCAYEERLPGSVQFLYAHKKIKFSNKQRLLNLITNRMKKNFIHPWQRSN